MKSKQIVICAILIAVLGAGIATAQTQASITLQGTVPAILEISVNAEAGINNLDLLQNLNMKIATAVERSNKRAGYTVTVSSANAQTAGAAAPFFKDSVDASNTEQLPYSISYDGTTASFSGGSAVVSNQTTKTTGTGAAKEVRLIYNGADIFPSEGSYADTLTFTITAN